MRTVAWVLGVSLFACGEEARVVESAQVAFSSELELRNATGSPTDTFAVGEPIEMVLRVRNESDLTQSVSLPTSQVFDFEVGDPSDGSRIWHWSHDMAFATVVTEVVFDAAETKEFSVVWDQSTNAGSPIPKGAYEAVGLVPSPEPGLRSAVVPFTIR
jgi:hypothetical protein